MKMNSILGAACIAAALAAAPSHAAMSADEQYEAGVLAYQSCQHADALTSLTLAAHAGHRRAQEIAGLMNLLGAPFYGSGVGADRAAAMRWFERAAMQGSEIGATITGIRANERVVETAPDDDGIPTEVAAGWTIG
jgi:TPR repeat protein